MLKNTITGVYLGSVAFVYAGGGSYTDLLTACIFILVIPALMINSKW
jgi:hypothetical protein